MCGGLITRSKAKMGVRWAQGVSPVSVQQTPATVAPAAGFFCVRRDAFPRGQHPPSSFSLGTSSSEASKGLGAAGPEMSD